MASAATLVGLQAYSFGSSDTIVLNGGTLSSVNIYCAFNHLRLNAPSTVSGAGFRTVGSADWIATAAASGSTIGPPGTNIKFNGSAATTLTITVADGANPGFDLLVSGNMGDYTGGHQSVKITGGGTVATTGVNSYSGSTTVTGGATLLINGTHTTTGVTGDNSTLTLTGQEFDDFTFNAVAGFGPGTYTLFDAGSISGSLGTETSGMIGAYGATLSIAGDGRMVSVTVVPEPSALILLAVGLLCLPWHLRRKRK